jgi:hypothetical protein
MNLKTQRVFFLEMDHNETAKCYTCGFSHKADIHVPVTDLLAKVRSVYAHACTRTKNYAVSRLERLIEECAGYAHSEMCINVGTQLRPLNDVSVEEVVEAFFVENPEMRACCVFETGGNLRVKL